MGEKNSGRCRGQIEFDLSIYPNGKLARISIKLSVGILLLLALLYHGPDMIVRYGKLAQISIKLGAGILLLLASSTMFRA